MNRDGNLLGNDELTVKYGGIDGIPTTFVIDKNNVGSFRRNK